MPAVGSTPMRRNLAVADVAVAVAVVVSSSRWWLIWARCRLEAASCVPNRPQSTIVPGPIASGLGHTLLKLLFERIKIPNHSSSSSPFENALSANSAVANQFEAPVSIVYWLVFSISPSFACSLSIPRNDQTTRANGLGNRHRGTPALQIDGMPTN